MLFLIYFNSEMEGIGFMKKNSLYNVGDVVTGFVTGIEKYGIFVNLDNYYSGLIHISEISNSFVRDINDYVSVGETIKVKILDIDRQHCHLKLSIKNMEYKFLKRKRNKIVETEHGFSTLNAMLKIWINNKKETIFLKKIKKI